MIDVRTPAEFEQGHIPGTINLPLFTNEERKIIGTLYKKEGKQPAILKGLELVGTKLYEFINEANKINNKGTLLLHCWRGGMRSANMAWLFEMYGFNCFTLRGGYKSFRNYVLESFNEQKNIIVLGGRTGSGKTLILKELQKQAHQIVDLEKIAHHKGSSFGAFGEEKQLSQEQFENELWHQFSKTDNSKQCFLEDESRKIGKNILPEGLWQQMRNASVICIDLAFEARVKYLVNEYGKFTSEELMAATERISKRLGGLNTKQAMEAIKNKDLKTACEITLKYYDKAYQFGLSQREKEKIVSFSFDKLNETEIANEIIKWKKLN